MVMRFCWVVEGVASGGHDDRHEHPHTFRRRCPLRPRPGCPAGAERLREDSFGQEPRPTRAHLWAGAPVAIR